MILLNNVKIVYLLNNYWRMNSIASKIDTGKSIIFGVELPTKQFYFYANSAVNIIFLNYK